MEPIIVEQEFKESKEKVWKLITQTVYMQKWFFEQITDFKAEVGFETAFLVEFDGFQFTHKWKIEEVIPGMKIVYNWSYAEYDGEAKVVFELFELKDKTLLKLTNTVLKSFPDHIEAFSRKSAENGWIYLIGQSLKDLLEQDLELNIKPLI